MVPRLEGTGSKLWELNWQFFTLGTRGFQDWEAFVPRFGNRLLVEVGAPGSKTGEPWVQTFQHRDWEASVPTFGSHWFLELGTAVPRPGSLGSNVWKPLVTSSYRTGTPGFQDWEALVRRFGNR